MRVHRLHPWEVSYSEARRIQERLRDEVRLRFPGGSIRTVAGADVSYSRSGRDASVFAGVVVLSWPELELVERVWVEADVCFPYVPGLLSFREAPALANAFERLTTAPDLVIVDGHGIAHPRGLGLAAHLGLILDLPSIGCAKKILIGEHGVVDRQRGACATLEYQGRLVGAALRTRNHVKPVYVSPGQKMDLEKSLELILASSRGYRLPEPTRLAHQYVTRIRKIRLPKEASSIA